MINKNTTSNTPVSPSKPILRIVNFFQVCPESDKKDYIYSRSHCLIPDISTLPQGKVRN